MRLRIGKEIPDTDTDQPEIINTAMQQRPMTLQLLESVNVVKSKDDNQDPLLTGLDFLPDGRLVKGTSRAVTDENIQYPCTACVPMTRFWFAVQLRTLSYT
ncbi:hypothetical protein DPMN_121126 [Dreissena polymorpha]|uniref:Uncharacterized protein n=1 Tax=Dreissena polymorpha TaxID=45954 RepID=A0A9D4JST8_DREPO|nr:hypothetical protein DPMN_121126 [Dreissena polymorpha]